MEEQTPLNPLEWNLDKFIERVVPRGHGFVIAEPAELAGRQICVMAIKGCNGVKNPDELYYRCTDILLSSICPGPRYFDENGGRI